MMKLLIIIKNEEFSKDINILKIFNLSNDEIIFLIKNNIEKMYYIKGEEDILYQIIPECLNYINIPGCFNYINNRSNNLNNL